MSWKGPAVRRMSSRSLGFLRGVGHWVFPRRGSLFQGQSDRCCSSSSPHQEYPLDESPHELLSALSDADAQHGCSRLEHMRSPRCEACLPHKCKTRAACSACVLHAVQRLR